VSRRSRGPRHKYAAEEIILRILSDERLFKTCEMVFSADRLIHASDISRKLGISVGHAYLLLKKLEKWGVLKGVRDPANGRLAFRPGSSKVAELVAEELRKRKVKEIEESLAKHLATEL